MNEEQFLEVLRDKGFLTIVAALAYFWKDATEEEKEAFDGEIGGVLNFLFERRSKSA